MFRLQRVLVLLSTKTTFGNDCSLKTGLLFFSRILEMYHHFVSKASIDLF